MRKHFDEQIARLGEEMIAMGAMVEQSGGYVTCDAPEGGLQGGHVYLDIVSVGATMNILLAATLANGMTVIEVDKTPFQEAAKAAYEKLCWTELRAKIYEEAGL